MKIDNEAMLGISRLLFNNDIKVEVKESCITFSLKMCYLVLKTESIKRHGDVKKQESSSKAASFRMMIRKKNRILTCSMVARGEATEKRKNF